MKFSIRGLINKLTRRDTSTKVQKAVETPATPVNRVAPTTRPVRDIPGPDKLGLIGKHGEKQPLPDYVADDPRWKNILDNISGIGRVRREQMRGRDIYNQLGQTIHSAIRRVLDDYEIDYDEFDWALVDAISNGEA